MPPTLETGWALASLVVVMAGSAIVLGLRGWRTTVSRRIVDRLLGRVQGAVAHKRGMPAARSHVGRRLWSLAPAPTGAAFGWILAGPMGLVVGGGAGAAVPLVRARRGSVGRIETLERELADLAETTSLALRSGLSVTQALEFAGSELEGPAREFFDRYVEERRLGVPFESALAQFGTALGTEDAQLFILVMNVHARSGGDLAGALEVVASTIGDRVAVRRGLRAGSTQGRVSGAILGTLPIAFFLMLAATSHRQLDPVYRSAPGIAMVIGGLVMECLAFLWIRSILRVGV